MKLNECAKGVYFFIKNGTMAPILIELRIDTFDNHWVIVSKRVVEEWLDMEM